MKTKILTITLLLTLLFSAFGINKVSAQEPECRDAAGAVIPCPPTQPSTGGGSDDNDDNDDNSGGGSGNQNPPATAATPTSTPLPLSVAPTSIPLPDEGYLGSCSNADGNVFDCFEKFKCEDGLLVIEVDLYAEGGTKYDFYCIPDGNIPQLNLPLTIPDPVGKDNNWSGGCNNDGLDACLDLMSSLCSEEGGEISIWYDEEGAGVYCQNQSEAELIALTATPLAIVAAPQDNSTTGGSWDEECSWATCWMSDLACWAEGGKGYGIEDSVGNTGYHCDLPAGSTSGNNLKQLGLATIVLVLIGMLVPAVQKIREAAARSKTSSHSAKMDLINKEEDNTEVNSDFLLEIDGIKGESKAHIKKATLFVRKSGGDSQDY